MYKFIVLVFVLILFKTGFVYSAYFDFVPTYFMLDSNGEVGIQLKFNIVGAENERFRVRPLADVGNVGIWDSERGIWVSGNSNWVEMPKLTAETRLKFLYPTSYKYELRFQIQDIQTARLYETPPHFVWSRVWFVRYVNALNKNIFKVIE